MSLRGFLEELRRRRVPQVALGYLVGGWIMVEVADIAFPRLGLPDWTITLVMALVILGLPLALILTWAFQVTPEGIRRDRSGARGRAGGPAPPAGDSASIAVLPFLNLSDDPENEYFSDGMTEEILNALVGVRHLHVASRTSAFAFKGSKEDIRQIAEKLSVATVLEGSVRRAGNRLRVTAQLIDAENGYHLWSDTYDREIEDLFAIQDDIARSIVEALRVELAGAEESEPLVRQTTDDLQAYTFYLKGRHAFTRFLEAREADLRNSLHYYEQALECDPSYAKAYAGIADTWMGLSDDWVAPDEGYPKAKKAAERALELEPSLAEAHTARGKVLGWYEWKFDEAELALRRAVGTSPNYPDAHWGLATILPANGQLEEGLEEMRTALALDPLSASFAAWVARFLFYSRRYDQAIYQARRALELDPSLPRGHTYVGLAQLAKGDGEAALETLREGVEQGNVLSMNAYVAQTLATIGREDEARAVLAELESASDDAYVRGEYVAGAWGALGEFDRAFAALDEAVDARSAGLIYLHVDPIYDPLRGDPRYGRLVEAVGVR